MTLIEAVSLESRGQFAGDRGEDGAICQCVAGETRNKIWQLAV
jgi:hypothetical protein